MPGISSVNKESLRKLVDKYNVLLPHEKLFYPGDLGVSLGIYNETPSLDAACALCLSFINKTWFFQRSFFPSLSSFSDTDLVRALSKLNSARLLTHDAAGQANFNAVAGHQNSGGVAWALRALNTAGLLTGEAAQANRNVLAGHQNPMVVAWALSTLNTARLLTGMTAQANFNAVAGHPNPKDVAWALRTLNTARLLIGETAQANFNAVVGHQNPRGVVSALSALNAARLLTGDAAQANFNAVVEHQNCWGMASALRKLNTARLLTQENFNLVAITHIDILCHPETGNNWTRFAAHYLTLAHFARIIEICVVNQGNLSRARRLFNDYVNREILGGINGSQTTHTASIHKTVSTSATKLMIRYGNKMRDASLDATIAEFSAWLNDHKDTSLKAMAAKRCLQRLIAPDYSFTDPNSRVSTKELLALVWLAFHDGTQRQGDLAEAKKALIEGLYEAQRGSNLSERGVDNGKADRPVCAGGTFNKIIEKGWGRHPDMELKYITKEWASAKFPIVVNEAAITYLKGLAESTDADKRDLSLSLVKKIMAKDNDHLVAPIWGIISDEVAITMFEEFGSLYANKKKSADFKAFIKAGVYVPLTEASMEKLDAMIPKRKSHFFSQAGFFASYNDEGNGAFDTPAQKRERNG